MEGRRKGRKEGNGRENGGRGRREEWTEREKQMKEDEEDGVGGWMEKGKEEVGARKKEK